MPARHYDAEAGALSQMSLALLALLIEEPTHGYALMRRCEDRFGDVMYVGNSKVYHELSALVRRGLIEEIEDEDAASRRRHRRQPRYPYRATGAGARAYRERVVGAFRDDPRAAAVRERILAVGAEDKRTLGAIVDRLEEDCCATAADDATPTGSLRDRLALEHRRLLLAAHAEFVKRARELLHAAAPAASAQEVV